MHHTDQQSEKRFMFCPERLTDEIEPLGVGKNVSVSFSGLPPLVLK